MSSNTSKWVKIDYSQVKVGDTIKVVSEGVARILKVGKVSTVNGYAYSDVQGIHGYVDIDVGDVYRKVKKPRKPKAGEAWIVRIEDIGMAIAAYAGAGQTCPWWSLDDDCYPESRVTPLKRLNLSKYAYDKEVRNDDA